jgi:hypothetical protein
MKRIYIKALLLGISAAAFAGGPSNHGSKGFMELVINPWANGSGWNGVNTATVKGVDAFNLNVGGLSGINSTNVAFSYTDYFHNAGIKLNAFGLDQKIGSGSYVGFSFVSMNFGNIERTDVNNPEGGIGTFSPRFNNFALGYAYKFSQGISCGLAFRGISESGAADVYARTAAMDAGVHYSAKSRKNNGLKNEDIHFGISLRNVGAPAAYRGDGLSYRITDADGVQRTMQIRTASVQLPTQLLIGLAYDIRLDRDTMRDLVYNNKLTVAFNYSSNSFMNSQYGLGFEYSYKNIFSLRAGYQYEDQILDKDLKINAMTGIAAGASVNIPLKKGSDNSIAFDYSYRDSRLFGGTNSFGIQFNFGDSKED